jgi:hypothetical protein
MFEQAVAREPERAVAQKLLASVSALRADPARRAPASAAAGSVRSEAP